jgi:transcription-repair coupling factor (superfamily II helicase)
LADIFGAIPIPIENLLIIIEVRIILKRSFISAIQITASQIILTISPTVPEDIRNHLIELSLKEPKTYKVTQKFQLIYKQQQQITPSNILNIVKSIAGHISTND